MTFPQIASHSLRDENKGVPRIREVALLCFTPLQEEQNWQ
jgi:hypothetical protein